LPAFDPALEDPGLLEALAEAPALLVELALAPVFEAPALADIPLPVGCPVISTCCPTCVRS
jgi:hypothetical protein